MRIESTPSPDPNESESPDQFPFSFDAAKNSKEKIEKDISTLRDRIDSLSKRTALQGGKVQIISQLMQITDDPKELKILGKALVKVSELIPHLTHLREQAAVAKMSLENPDELMLLFGDFTSHFESLEPDHFTIKGATDVP